MCSTYIQILVICLTFIQQCCNVQSTTTSPPTVSSNTTADESSSNSSSTMTSAPTTTEPSEPLNVTTVVLSKSQIEVSWVTPYPANGIILHYVVYYGSVNRTTSDNGTSVNGTSVNITGLSTWTTYIFEVSACNSAGCGNKSTPATNTTLEGKPSGTSNVVTAVWSKSQIEVSWDPPDHANGIILRYVVYYDSVNRTTSDNGTSVNITGLSTWTTYCFQVVACTSAGCGNKSTSATNRTLEDKPSKPSNVVTVVWSKSQIEVLWDAPDPANGIILRYVVYYDSDNRTTSDNGTSVNITGLSTWTTYCFQVVACTSAGCGNKSTSATNRTLEDIPCQPELLEATTNSSKSIALSWRAPVTANGVIRGYRIYVKKGFQTVKTQNVSDSNTTIIGGLEIWTEYMFTISACTSMGCGPESNSTSQQTDEDIPGPPQCLNATAVSNHSIYLSWEAPLHNHGEIEHYEISYTDEMLKTWSSQNTTDAKTTCEIDKLGIWTKYTFKVRACDSKGCGPWSNNTSSRTHEGTPGKPSELGITINSSTEMQIHWSKPDSQRGKIRLYKICHWKCRTAEEIDLKQKDQDCLTNPKFTQCNETQNTEIVLSNLSKHTCYGFTVAAQTSAGWGLANSISNCTKEDSPSDVQQLKARAETSTHVYLSWEPPLNKNGIIRYYDVCYSSEDNSSCLEGDTTMQWNNTWSSSSRCCRRTESATNRTDVSHLHKWTLYTFSIRACTVSCGPFVNITIRTKQDRPTSPVTDIVTDNKTSESIRLSWHAPSEPNGIITHYVIRYSFRNHLCSDDINTSAIFTANCTTEDNNTYTTIHKLFPYWNYNFTVTPVTAPGEGLKRAEHSERTDESEPGDISKETINPSSTNSTISVEWNTPCYPNGEITNYTIQLEGGNCSIQASTGTTTTHTFSNLLPYRNYKVRVQAWTTVGSGNYTDWKTIMTVQSGPYKPRDVEANVLTWNSIRVSWTPPVMRRGDTNYTVITFDNGENKTSNQTCRTQGFRNTTCDVTGLDAYWSYRFTVEAQTDKYKNQSDQSITYTTNEAKPGAVANFCINAETNVSKARTFDVMWSQPSARDRNGIITNYYLTYSYQSVQTTLSFTGNVTRKIIEDVKADKSYTFKLFASTSAGNGTVCTRSQSISAGAPILTVTPDNRIIASDSASEPKKQIAVTISMGLLCDCAQGTPKEWGVIVVENSAYRADVETFSGTRLEFHKGHRYSSWEAVHELETITPYIASDTWKPCSTANFCSGNTDRRKRAARQATARYVVGTDGECEGNTNTYCNGYLQPGRSYRVKFYVCTDYGCAETGYSNEIETDPDMTVAIVAGLLSGLVVIFAAGIVLFLRRRQQLCFREKKTIRDPDSNGGESNSGCDEFDLEFRNKRPVKLSNFLTHVTDMKRDSNLKFAEEYRILKEKSPCHPCTEAEKIPNRIKNRYTNILPYDHSRVKLLPLDDEDGSDYINANYMPGFSSQREYIAAQGPLPGTKDDFWRMVWEQNVHIIVMLTQLKERGKIKCDKYWPDQVKEPVFIGDLIIQMYSESVLPDYTIRVIELKLGDRSRIVKQFHFLKWPDFGCPEKTWPVINFIVAVRLHMPHIRGCPNIIHCSAGVGRTGTFITVDHLIQHIQEHDDIDIYGLVYQLRDNRPNMVQTEDQYVFIHDCMRDYMLAADEADDEGDENIYMNDPGEEAIYQNTNKL
ncbi:hypothetical protein ScPMuIL_013382 [Solemya velum]